jgi:hypothetical protein
MSTRWGVQALMIFFDDNGMQVKITGSGIKPGKEIRRKKKSR